MSKTKMNFLQALFAAFFLSVILLTGCKNSPTDPAGNEPQTDQQAMEKLSDEDSSLASFEDNYNEDEAMSFFGKTQAEIYPYRVGHKVRLTNRTLTVDVVGDTAYGTLTKEYTGTLFIAASYDTSATGPDTLIKKAFSSTITRKLIFVKIANTDRPIRNWRLAAVSLPEGGVLSSNIDIQKLTIFLPGDDTLVITSPNSYFLSRGAGWWRQVPVIERGRDVTLQLEVYSAYPDTDFVTLTWGAEKGGMHRAKRKFELVSSTPSGSGYLKVYEQTYNAHNFPGHYHAVINAFPKQVIFDDAAPVESEVWGIPYFVKR